MTVIVKELRDALIAAGVPPEKAEAAAKAVLPRPRKRPEFWVPI